MEYLPRTSRHWRSSRRSRETCKIETLSLRKLKIESTSCQCSTSHPVFKSISALSRGILRRKSNRDTSMRLLRTQNSYVERCTQQISSVSTKQSQAGVKISVKGRMRKEQTSERFVAKEKEQLLNNVKPQEVHSSVQTSRSDDPASGNRLRECLQNFDTLEKSLQFTKSLRRCVILEKTPCWNVLQYQCRRR